MSLWKQLGGGEGGDFPDRILLLSFPWMQSDFYGCLLTGSLHAVVFTRHPSGTLDLWFGWAGEKIIMLFDRSIGNLRLGEGDINQALRL